MVKLLHVAGREHRDTAHGLSPSLSYGFRAITWDPRAIARMRADRWLVERSNPSAMLLDQNPLLMVRFDFDKIEDLFLAERAPSIFLPIRDS